MDDRPKLTEQDLAGFHGSDRLYRHWSGLFCYTEGIRYLCERGECWWLADAVASWQLSNSPVFHEPFQVWVLTRTTGHDAVLEANDGDSETNVLVRQVIPHTDFPLPRIELFLVVDGDGRTLLLPSEY